MVLRPSIGRGRKLACIVCSLASALGLFATRTATAQGLPQAAGVGASAGIGAEPAQQNEVYITLIADDRDLRSVVGEIARKAGVNIYVEPKIEEVVTVRLINLPWHQVLELIATDAQCELEEKGPRLFVLTQPPHVSMEFEGAPLRMVLDLLARQAGKNLVIASDVQGTVSLTLRNVNWFKALDTIVKTAGYVSVQEGPDIIRIVRPETLKLELSTRVYPLLYLRPPDEYKAVISETGGVGAPGGAAAGGLAGRTFLANTLPPRGLEDFTLNKALQGMVETRVGESVQYNVESNSFIINARATKHQEIAALLKKIDVEPMQVFLDVHFIATSNKDFFRAGLKAGDPVGSPSEAGARANLGLGGTSNFFDPRFTNQGLPVNAQNGTFPFEFGESVRSFAKAFAVPAVLSVSDTNLALQFAQTDQLSKVTQAPQLLTLNDREATIFVGERVPFIQQTASLDQNGNVAVTIAEAGRSPAQIGFTLFITPHIVRDTDQIIITIIPRVARLTGGTPGANGLVRFTVQVPTREGVATSFVDLPHTADQTIVTKLLIRDNTTAVIGGLMSETQAEIEERIPVLSSIPVLGNLFKFHSDDYDQENLIIFVTPRIVKSGADSSELFARQYQIFQENDFFYQRYLREKEEGEDHHATPAKRETHAKSGPAGEPLGPTPVGQEPPPVSPTAAPAGSAAPPPPAAQPNPAEPMAPVTPPESQPKAPPSGADTPPPPPAGSSAPAPTGNPAPAPEPAPAPSTGSTTGS